MKARMDHSVQWWSARLETMNAETESILFRDCPLMGWIALAAWFVICMLVPWAAR